MVVEVVQTGTWVIKDAIWPGIAQVAAAIATGILALLAFFQWYSMHKTRQADLYIRADQLLREIGSDRIRLMAFDDNSAKWGTGREHADKVIRVYEQVAYLVAKRLVKKQRILDEYGPTFVEVWKKTKAHIMERRSSTGGSGFASHLQSLAENIDPNKPGQSTD